MTSTEDADAIPFVQKPLGHSEAKGTPGNMKKQQGHFGHYIPIYPYEQRPVHKGYLLFAVIFSEMFFFGYLPLVSWVVSLQGGPKVTSYKWFEITPISRVT